MKAEFLLPTLILTSAVLTGCTPTATELADSQLTVIQPTVSSNVLFVARSYPSNTVSPKQSCTVLEQDGEIYRAIDTEFQYYSQEFWEGYDNGDYSSVFALVGEAGEEYAEKYRIAAEAVRSGENERLYPEAIPAVEDDYYYNYSIAVDGELVSLCSYGNNSGVQSYSSSDEIMEVCAWLREEFKGRSQNP